MEQTEPWSQRFAGQVGQLVVLWRDRLSASKGRKITTQAIADRTGELGHPIDRSVIAKLEKGHRQSITVPELFVLARALEVPPTLLLLPIGAAETVEVSPGYEVSVADALLWLTGTRPLPEEQWDEASGGTSTVASFQVHQARLDSWFWSRYYARGLRDGSIDAARWARQGRETPEMLDAAAEKAAAELRALRAAMRSRSLVPPPLPPDLADLDEEVPRT